LLRIRYLVSLAAVIAAIGAGAAWAAGGSTTTPGTSTPTPGTTTTPAAPKDHGSGHNCPNMGSGSSSQSGAAYTPAMPGNF
jgi:hypothetical protein